MIQFTQNSELSVTLPFNNYRHIKNPTKCLKWSAFFRILCNPGIFRTLPYSDPKKYSEPYQASVMQNFLSTSLTLAYLESWYSQNLGNIQNPIKHLWCSVLLMNLKPWHFILWCILLRTLCNPQNIQNSRHSK